MAQQPATGGATKYVHKKNSALTDDLKLQMGKNGLPLKSGARPNSQAPRASNNENRPLTRSASKGQLSPADVPTGQAFYDTDGSILSKDSTAVTMQQQQSANAPRQSSRSRGHSHDGMLDYDRDKYMVVSDEEEVTDNGTGDDDNEDDDVPDDPLPKKVKRKAKVRCENVPNGAGLGPVDGDSYPDTTSGRPSNADVNDYQGQDQGQGQPPVQTQSQATQLMHGGLAVRGSGSRVPGGDRGPNGSGREHPQRPTSVHHAHPTHLAQNTQPTFQKGVPDAAAVLGDIQSGFGWGMNMSRPNGAQQPQVHGQNKAPAHGPVPHAPPTLTTPAALTERRQTAHEHQPPTPQTQQRERMPPPQQQRPQTSSHIPPAQQQQRPQTSSHMHPAQNRQQQRQMQQPPPPNVNLHPPTEDDQQYESEGQSDPAGPRENPHFDEQLPYEHPSSPPRVHAIALDFEERELYQMSFSDLKKADFDTDPNGEELELPDEHKDKTLQHKLDLMKSLQPQDQQFFFQSLSIEQWEDAGDWFIECFGKIMQNFRAARREKRKAAHEFEDEVEERYAAVSKKRKMTQDALSEMKKSGGMVLQGTPTKIRKTKGR